MGIEITCTVLEVERLIKHSARGYYVHRNAVMVRAETHAKLSMAHEPLTPRPLASMAVIMPVHPYANSSATIQPSNTSIFIPPGENNTR